MARSTTILGPQEKPASPGLGPVSDDTTVATTTAPSPGGDWPNTTRLLPWMIATFLVVLWLVPIDGTFLPVQLPVDSTIDRFELVTLLFVWVIAVAGGTLGPRWRRSKVNLGIALFLAAATVSVLINLTGIARAEELELAFKKLSLLFCYAAFFLIVATGLRGREVPRFILLALGLACIAALGTIVEYRAGHNYFYELSAKLPLLTVEPEPPDPEFARPSIVGPTHHGLAIATILAMAIPFAMVGLMRVERLGRKVLYGLALGLLLAGSVATLRKTALVVPLAAVAALVIYRPRQMVRLIPLGIVMLVFVQGVSPGALSGIRYQLEGGSELSNQGRTSDYAAVAPDVASHPLLGSGYGTYDPKIYLETNQRARHRILDNQYLLLLIEVGILGLIAYFALGGLAIAGLHRSARGPDLARAGPALAVISSTVAFLTANALFDTLAFPQVPYFLFFLLGLGVVAAQRPAGPEPSAG